MLTQDYLKSILHYDPDTGIFTWLVNRWRTDLVGHVAGCVQHVNETKNKTEYWVIKIDGKTYKAHRLAFLYMTGSIPEEVDHDDLNGLNNRWLNLRVSDKYTNKNNVHRRKDNTSGVKGVCWYARGGNWRVQIRGHHLGYFDTKEEAAVAYEKAARELFGEFARTE